MIIPKITDDVYDTINEVIGLSESTVKENTIRKTSVVEFPSGIAFASDLVNSGPLDLKSRTSADKYTAGKLPAIPPHTGPIVFDSKTASEIITPATIVLVINSFLENLNLSSFTFLKSLDNHNPDKIKAVERIADSNKPIESSSFSGSTKINQIKSEPSKATRKPLFDNRPNTTANIEFTPITTTAVVAAV